MLTTRVLYNSTKKAINIPTVGVEIPPGEQVSLTGQYQPHIILENFPGLVDVTDLSEEEQAQHNADLLSNEAPSKPAEEPSDEQG